MHKRRAGSAAATLFAKSAMAVYWPFVACEHAPVRPVNERASPVAARSGYRVLSMIGTSCPDLAPAGREPGFDGSGLGTGDIMAQE